MNADVDCISSIDDEVCVEAAAIAFSAFFFFVPNLLPFIQKLFMRQQKSLMLLNRLNLKQKINMKIQISIFIYKQMNLD